MVKVESILKWKLEGPVLKKIKMMRAQILNKNEDAVALPDSDLHITLASGPGWKEIRRQVKAGDFDEPDFKIDIEPTFKVMEQGGRKSWYVKMKDQRNWKEYVMDLLQGTHDARRVYHITIANLTGKTGDSIAMVEERDYKDEYKKFQSSKKMKKYRAELNRYNRRKGTYGNGDGKDASHKKGKIVGYEDESTNRGRAEKSRLIGSKRSVDESIKRKDLEALKSNFEKNFKPMLFYYAPHVHRDHTDREKSFNPARLVKTFNKLRRNYKKEFIKVSRSRMSDTNRGDNRHYIYDEEWDYTIIFVIDGDKNPEVFKIITAYPGEISDRDKRTIEDGPYKSKGLRV